MHYTYENSINISCQFNASQTSLQFLNHKRNTLEGFDKDEGAEILSRKNLDGTNWGQENVKEAENFKSKTESKNFSLF